MAGLRGALIVEDDKANEKSRDTEHVLLLLLLLILLLLLRRLLTRICAGCPL